LDAENAARRCRQAGSGVGRIEDPCLRDQGTHLSNLSQYLIEFEAKATANGIRVHWARDAHEHNQIVYDLLTEHQVSTLVKSKSMLTEECELRPFLETRGIRVTETDLGERIQQLDEVPYANICPLSVRQASERI
jgi:L-lactate dehydrogenase complex protein LldF